MVQKPFVTIIVPVYNEEEDLKESLSRLYQVVQKDLYSKKRWPTEILIVDDGSTDNSSDILKEFAKNKTHIFLLRHKKNKGKGAAISTALKKAKGYVCIIHDSDLEYNPFEIPGLLKHIINNEAHVVFGSRFLEFQNYGGLWFNLMGNKILSLVGSFLIKRWITDIMTCYKAFRRELLDGVSANSFDVELEITAKLLLKRNVRFLEFPISYKPRIEGKKITKLDGVISLWRLIRTIRTTHKERLSKFNKNKSVSLVTRMMSRSPSGSNDGTDP